MSLEAALAIIDQEIARLDEAKRLLAGENKARKFVQHKRGVMSAAGRARVAAAQKARWAKFHKAEGK